MRLFFLVFCLIYLQLSNAASEEDVKSRENGLSENSSTSPLWSGLLRWFFNSNSHVGSAPKAESDGAQSAQTRSTQISTNLLNPIRSFVTQASTAAKSAITGLRDRLSNTMSTITDYIVNGIPYAQESSKVPNQHIPEYAKGSPLPKYDDSKFSDRTFSSWYRGKSNVKKEKSPEQVYQAFVDRLEGKSYYNTYYNLKDANMQYIKDYEQLMEDQKATKKYGNDAINVLIALYRKLEEVVRHNKKSKD